jgi:UDP-N-acetylmuramoylalanine--D-glutamate ligase
VEIAKLPIEGIHNVQNALATVAAAKLMGVGNSEIERAFLSFKGIKHRLEFVAKVDGVTYIDDSKGTNVDATLKAVQCMKQDTVLLLGGKNKGYDYSRLFSALMQTKVVHAVLYGENRFELLKCASAQGYEKISLCDTFAFALQIAKLRAVSGQTVLLSPASASFDEFASYEERGDVFVEFVRNQEKETVGTLESGKENKEEVPQTENGKNEKDEIEEKRFRETDEME